MLERLAKLEEAEQQRERERERKKPVNNRRSRSLGTKQGHRYCVDQSCEFFLVKVPVELEGTETEILFKDESGGVTDKVESSTITWDFAHPEEARCSGCRKIAGNLPPDSPPPAAGFDDLTALQRRRIRIGDEDALSIKSDIKAMRDRQAKVLETMAKANLEVQEAVTDDIRLD
jgi:hypothetical protein